MTHISIMPGVGDGSFLSEVPVPGTNGSKSATAMDANGDGKVDLLVTFAAVDGGAETMQTFYGDGAGTFSTTAP